jgi:flagellar assembly protein FliH
MDDEETPGMEYRPYSPQVFDEGEEGAAAPAAGLPTGEGEFRQEFRIAPGTAASFEEGPRLEPGSETDFASIKFQRENTLLTNAESYAASIREEAQLYVRQLRGEVEHLNQEAEQRYEEAQAIKAQAQAQAERLVAEAQAQVDEIREQARQEGFQAGQDDGLKKRYEEAQPQLERLEGMLAEIAQFRRRVAFYTEKDGVRLALIIAKKLLQAELKVNKQVVARLLASALAKLEGKGTFRVWLSPEDYQFVAAARPALERYLDEEQALTLRAKPALSAGNVLIETDRETIDLTFESQFYHLEQQFKQTLAERESQLQNRRGAAKGASQPGASQGTRPAPGARPPAPRKPAPARATTGATPGTTGATAGGTTGGSTVRPDESVLT